MLHRTLGLAAILLAALHAAAAAQLPLVPEQRVRVVITQGELQYRTAATVMEVSPDSVLLQVRGTQRYYPVSALSEVEVSAGRGSRPKWALFGVLSGAALGYAFTLYDRNGVRPMRQELVSCNQQTCIYRLVKVPYGDGRIIGFTVAGSVLGAVTGWLLPRDRWRPVDAQRTAPAPLPPPQQPAAATP